MGGKLPSSKSDAYKLSEKEKNQGGRIVDLYDDNISPLIRGYSVEYVDEKINNTLIEVYTEMKELDFILDKISYQSE